MEIIENNITKIDAKSFWLGFDFSVEITDEEILNIYLHMQGKAEGLQEAKKKCNFPVMFSRALIKYMKGKANDGTGIYKSHT